MEEDRKHCRPIDRACHVERSQILILVSLGGTRKNPALNPDGSLPVIVVQSSSHQRPGWIQQHRWVSLPHVSSSYHSSTLLTESISIDVVQPTGQLHICLEIKAWYLQEQCVTAQTVPLQRWMGFFCPKSWDRVSTGPNGDWFYAVQ